MGVGWGGKQQWGLGFIGHLGKQWSLSTCRYFEYFHQPCGVCGREECLGNRVERIAGPLEQYQLRAGHHKTDTRVGVLQVPLPSGLVALLHLWEYASHADTGRVRGVSTLFYSPITGLPFTEQGISSYLTDLLAGILKGKGLPEKNPRGLRHLWATSFSDFASGELVRDQEAYRYLQHVAATLMGTSVDKFKVRGQWGGSSVHGLESHVASLQCRMHVSMPIV